MPSLRSYTPEDGFHFCSILRCIFYDRDFQAERYHDTRNRRPSIRCTLFLSAIFKFALLPSPKRLADGWTVFPSACPASAG